MQHGICIQDYGALRSMQLPKASQISENFFQRKGILMTEKKRHNKVKKS